MAKVIYDIPIPAKRAIDAHKGDFGSILVIGGCLEMSGAPALCGLSALRSGAGLVSIASPKSVQLTIAGLVPCATTICLQETNDGKISRLGIKQLLKEMPKSDTIAIGCGMGQSSELQVLIETIVKEFTGPIIIDADGLNNLSRLGGLPLNNNIILTPHPGEMKRLWASYSRNAIPTDRSLQAEELSSISGAIVVLKGANTVITDSNSTYINTSGNPGMATGGSGDCLTGIIAALAAGRKSNKLFLLGAAILGVYLHGLSGDIAAADMTQESLIASDIIDYLPEAFRELE